MSVGIGQRWGKKEMRETGKEGNRRAHSEKPSLLRREGGLI